MSAQILERDVLRSRQARIPLRYGIVYRELVLLLQHQQRAAGELLRDRTDGEHRVRRHRRGGLDVGQAVTACEDDLAVLHDADGNPDDVLVGNLLAEDAVDLRWIDWCALRGQRRGSANG